MPAHRHINSRDAGRRRQMTHMTLGEVFTTGKRTMQDGIQETSELRGVARALVGLGGLENEIGAAALKGIGIDMAQVNQWISALTSPMPFREALQYVAARQDLVNLMDQGSNLSPRDGYFQQSDIAGAMNGDRVASPADYAAMKSLHDNYNELLRYAKQDPENPYDLPNMKAIRVAAGLDSFAVTMNYQSALRHFALHPFLLSLVDTGGNLSQPDGYFDRNDLTAVYQSNGSISANDKASLKALIDNYAELADVAKRDPANPHKIPNMKAVRVAAGLESFSEPPTTIRGACQLIIQSTALMKAIDQGANLSQEDKLFELADLTAVYRNSSLTSDQQTAIRTLIDDFDSVKAKSLGYAPNIYQLASTHGLAVIAERG
jgi:hypothetical protein